MLFETGKIFVTPGVLAKISGYDIMKALRRHVYGDWGELDDEDKAENEFSVENGYRILSSYTSSNGIKFWVITEADRSATTVLLPEEY